MRKSFHNPLLEDESKEIISSRSGRGSRLSSSYQDSKLRADGHKVGRSIPKSYDIFSSGTANLTSSRDTSAIYDLKDEIFDKNAGYPIVMRRLVWFLESRTYYSALTIIIILNIVGLLISTEPEVGSELIAWTNFNDLICANLFLVEYVIRIIIAPMQKSSRLRYIFYDGYGFVDLVSFLPYFVDWAINPRDNYFITTQWVKILRLFYPLQERYLGFNIFSKMFVEQRGIFLTSGFCGFATWIITSALYHIFEVNNEKMVYCPYGEEHPDLCYNRFQSIPGTMYFSLINFLGEYPLIDKYTTGGRFVAGFIQVIGAAIIAIPASVFGSAFEGLVQEAVESSSYDGDYLSYDDDVRQISLLMTKNEMQTSFISQRAARRQATYELFVPRTSYLAYDKFVTERTWETVKAPLIEVLDGESKRQLKDLSSRWRLDLGVLCAYISTFLVCGSALHCVFQTFPAKDASSLGASLLNSFYLIYILSTLLFFFEFIIRILDAVRNGTEYSNYMAVVDILAWLPAFLDIFASPFISLPQNFSSLSVVMLFKMERYVNAFRVFDDIIYDNRSVFIVTGYVAITCWVFCSILMYYAERDNPDDNIQKYYTSIFTAMWMTLLNLTGEAPLSDYSCAGRWITGLMGCVAVAFVTIPMGVLGNGFSSYLEEDAEAEETSEIRQKTLKFMAQPSMKEPPWLRASKFLTMRQQVFRFLQGNRVFRPSSLAIWFEVGIFVLIGLSSICAILETVKGIRAPGSWVSRLFDNIEFIAVMVFTIEYILRFYASPEDHDWKVLGYTTPGAKRLRYFVSPFSIVDLIAIIPYYVACAGSSIANEYDGQLRMLRVLRLITLDHYVPSVSLMGRIVRRHDRVLRSSFYVTFCFWFLFAALLSLTESHDETMVNDLRQSYRYHSLIEALPYTMIHLTGDYPLIDYTLASKAVLGVSLVIAVGVVAVPAGILASGFTSELQLYRLEKREMQVAASNVIEKAVHSYIIRRRFQKVVDQALAEHRELRRKVRKAATENDRCFRMCRFIERETPYGRIFGYIIFALIISNVILVLLESLKPKPMREETFDLLETFSVLLFTIDYIIRLYTAKVNKFYGCSRAQYGYSFFGIIDLVTILPWWIEISVWILFGWVWNAYIFRVFRLFRILQLEKFVKAFGVLRDVWYSAKDSLVSTLFIAVLVWVIGSCSFYACERNNPRMEGAFQDLPSSMYYSVIFLGGEWGKCDFTAAGKCVCMFYCLAGIAVFALPVGSVFEAFGEALQGQKRYSIQLEKRKSQWMKKATGDEEKTVDEDGATFDTIIMSKMRTTF